MFNLYDDRTLIISIIIFISRIEGQIFDSSSYSCINKNFDVKFSLLNIFHSGWNSTSNCSLLKCNLNSNDNTNCCSLLTTPYYEYQSLNGTIYCAPGILCSILEPCNIISSNNCSTNNSICVINSCCFPQSICLPLIFMNFCKSNANITDFKETMMIQSEIISFENIEMTSMISSTIGCEEVQLIDEKVSEMITVSPNDLSKEEKMNFELRSLNGVSFPENNIRPTIIIDFGKLVQIQSIILPRNKTKNNNVEQFKVTFYSKDGNKINENPILSYFNSISIQINSTEIPSNISCSWIELTILHTFDNKSPKGVILDIKGCILSIFDGWTNSVNMKEARYEHTASLLLNGKVLIIGGSNGNIYFNSAELYDPLLRTWIFIPNMNYQRYFHRSTVLINGNVLVTGGSNDTYFLQSSELFNSLTNTWIITSNMNYQRAMHAQILLTNGKIFVSGGFNGVYSLKTAELYDSLTNTWTITSNMTNARHWHTASLLNNGNILIIGGFCNNSALNTVELYDPSKGTWRNMMNMKNSRYWHTASVLSDGKVLVIGGFNGFHQLNSVELYDPLNENWINISSMNNPRYQHTATLLNNGKVLVTGGYNGTIQLSSTELYDPLTGNWTIIGNMNQPRYRHSATLLNIDRVLVTGGQFALFSIDSTELSLN